MLATVRTVVVLVLLGLAMPAAAASDAEKCTRALLLAAGKQWSCLFRARAAATLDGTAADLRSCLTRYGTKLLAVHQKYGAACPQDVWSGGSQRFVDQSDGTVRDRATGLEWEQKRSLDGKPNRDDPHDADNTYTWTAKPNGKEDNGTAFTELLAKLNGGTCFATHCDWRLPSLAELQTILVDLKPCVAKPCIDPVFGPTASSVYWTSDTSPYHPARAWYLFFLSGYWTTAPKVTPYHVRAVRGGR